MIDPGTGKTMSQCSDHGAEETKLAIQKAHVAYKKWDAAPGKTRGDVLAKLRDLCIEHL
jgi:acyl-CoA reductase-like NAD-dependent aldehyde dehydrogenase